MKKICKAMLPLSCAFLFACGSGSSSSGNNEPDDSVTSPPSSSLDVDMPKLSQITGVWSASKYDEYGNLDVSFNVIEDNGSLYIADYMGDDSDGLDSCFVIENLASISDTTGAFNLVFTNTDYQDRWYYFSLVGGNLVVDFSGASVDDYSYPYIDIFNSLKDFSPVCEDSTVYDISDKISDNPLVVGHVPTEFKQ